MAARSIEENSSELQSAMSHQCFDKRVSLGAHQVAASSYLAWATRKHATTIIALEHTLSSAQRHPPNQQQQEEEKKAAQQQQ